MQDHGGLYGFCPAKVIRDDYETSSLFKVFVIASETGQLPYDGSIMNQPEWVVDILSWFAPLYSKLKWISNAKMILPAGNDKKGKRSGNITRRPPNNNNRR